MRIAQVLAGISLAEADVLRKAVGKKDAELIRQELGKFVEKSVARGYDRSIIEELAGPDRDVRPLRLQQVALGRVLGHLVPHGVAQGALSGRVHGGAPVVVDRRHGQRRQVHQRGARARHRGAAAGRERVGLQVHRHRREADPLRARRDSQRRPRARSTRFSPRATRRPFTSLLRFLRARRPARSATSACSRRSSRRARSTTSADIARSTGAVLDTRDAGSVAQAAGDGDAARSRCSAAPIGRRRAAARAARRCRTSRRWPSPSG